MSITAHNSNIPRPQLQYELNSELKAVPKAHQQRNILQRISVSMKCQHACLSLNQHLVLESLGYFTETITKKNYSIVGATSHPWCLQSTSVTRLWLLVCPHIELFSVILCFFTCIVPVLHKRWQLPIAYVPQWWTWCEDRVSELLQCPEGQVSWISWGLDLPLQWMWPSCPHQSPTNSFRHGCLHPLYPFRTRLALSSH